MRRHARISIIAFTALALLIPPSAAYGAEPTPVFKAKWGTNGSGTGQFQSPWGLFRGADGTLYVADSNNDRVQEFSPSGNYLGQWGATGSAEGQFLTPFDVATDSSGNFYVTDANNARIQKFDPSGTFLQTWGWGVDDGTSVFQICTSGCQAGKTGNGAGQFFGLSYLAVDSSDTIYVADTGNHRVQKFSTSGTLLGSFGSTGAGDGQFWSPTGIAIDTSDTIYVADGGNGRVQMWSPGGASFLGSFGSPGSGDGQLQYPTGLAFDAAGDLYVAEWNNHRVQKFGPTGTFLTSFGSEGAGDGQFQSPTDLVTAPDGSVYVSDTSNHRIQRFGPPETSIAIKAPRRVRIGARAKVSGALESADAACVDRQKVVLKRGETRLASLRTSATGEYAFRIQVQRRMTVRVSYAGTLGCGASISVKKIIAIRR